MIKRLSLYISLFLVLCSFRFVVVGDTRSEHTAHRRVVEKIAQLNPSPEFTLVTGDLVSSGTRSIWETWRGIVDSAYGGELTIDWSVKPCQYIGAAGNHDDNSYPLWREFLPCQADWNGDGVTFWFTHENVLFLVLNSTRMGEGRTSDAWLEQILSEKASQYDWIFAFWHYPPYPFGGKGLDRSRRDWCPILQHYGADIIFNGHAHYYTRSYPMYMDGSDHPQIDNENGIIEVITGGGGANLRDVTPDDHGYSELLAYGEKIHHFVVVDIDGGQLQMKTIDVDGNVIDSVDVLKDTNSSIPKAPLNLRIIKTGG